jgi:hypothetical protein
MTEPTPLKLFNSLTRHRDLYARPSRRGARLFLRADGL